MPSNKKENTLIIVITLFIALITFFIIFQFLNSEKNEKQLSQQQIIQEAKAHFKAMVDTRSWNAQFGGVYVKAINGLKPNPYLKDNTLRTSDNKLLIKINPAWMTRQISEISNKKGNYHFKITSLIPINPSNKADHFETKALNYFAQNKKDKYFYTFNDTKESFDFMGSLKVKASCMKCHAQQGYKIGDIRGGIRVSIPIKVYKEHMSILEEKTKTSIIIVLFIALLFVGIAYWFITILYKRKYEIEHANEILEEKVSQRTDELEVALSHEEYLKDVLKIITEVNEMLITSYSMQSILKNATSKLSANEAYTLVLSGLIHEGLLEIISKSQEQKSLIPENIISLDETSKQNYLIKAIQKASKLKHPIIEKVPSTTDETYVHRRGDDVELKWMIVLPLLHGFDNDAYGMITVFCSSPNGFELEEMKILENMAHDISIALYSHKQRDSILAMEKEKIANYEETIIAFVNIIEQRDTYTAGHTIRVAEYCKLIAKQMDIEEKDIQRLAKAAILHDIGKVATPDTILLKPGKLSHLEYELIKQHSEVGADMLEKITIYKDLATIIRYHHSRYDGKGYPKTTSPDEIPFLSHIMIVADAFDAMTTNRIYRPRKNISDALAELTDGSGMQFHPNVVKAAMIALKDVNLKNSTQMPSSELEKQRMSYFFQDYLTGLYNEDYLHIALNSDKNYYNCLNVINLKKFTQYNQLNGWEEGNRFLQGFAKILTDTFTKAIIIRYHGDDFLLLDRENRTIQDVKQINHHAFIKNSNIQIVITHHEFSKSLNYEAFKKLEDKGNFL